MSAWHPICGWWAFVESPRFTTSALRQALMENLLGLPKSEDLAFDYGEIDLRRERHERRFVAHYSSYRFFIIAMESHDIDEH
jgi:hypothetical protein